MELQARIRALTRRGNLQQPTNLQFDNLNMDRLTRQVSRGHQKINLTKLEFQLLEYLLLNRQQVVSRRMLGRDVWHQEKRVTPIDNVIDVHIARLRRKLDTDGHVKLLHTVRGVGYLLSAIAP